MLGRKLTDVLVLKQIQSAQAVISCIKMLTSIEIITKGKVSKQNGKKKQENRLKHTKCNRNS